jgi:hypothetical protein
VTGAQLALFAAMGVLAAIALYRHATRDADSSTEVIRRLTAPPSWRDLLYLPLPLAVALGFSEESVVTALLVALGFVGWVVDMQLDAIVEYRDAERERARLELVAKEGERR